MNKYKLTWAIFIPIKGNITLRDMNIIYKSGILSICGYRHNRWLAHFDSKESAIEILSRIKGLHKHYEVILITDAQFGLLTYNQNPEEIATKLQLTNKILI